MQTIYRPSGRYPFLALNLYNGRCPHLCSYCYVPSVRGKTREQWECEPWHVRYGVIEALKRDAPKYVHETKRVLLCFHCDPYSPEAAASGVTRQALEVLRSYDIPFQVLTKGGMRAVSDFDLYRPGIDAFATTMTYLDKRLSLREEPGAAEPMDRIAAICRAKKQGIETWVSLEPVLDTHASLEIIGATYTVVDLYKIGKLNHDPEREAKIDWGAFAWEAMNLCNKYSKPFIFKKGLLEYCDFEIVGAAKFDPRLIKGAL